jgi:hypothetical protein
MAGVEGAWGFVFGVWGAASLAPQLVAVEVVAGGDVGAAVVRGAVAAVAGVGRFGVTVR